jgi:uncharacterized protein (TIGR02391 family)
VSADAGRAAADTARLVAGELAEYAVRIDSSEPSASDTGVDPTPLTPDAALLADFDARVHDADLRAASRSRFISKHYADAVEAGVKALNELIRARSGRSDDGDSLMTNVFSVSTPILKVNKLRSKSDETEQRGHMQLCQGVVAAWRNPRAHALLEDSPQRALMMLSLIDDLMTITRSAVRARKRKSP